MNTLYVVIEEDKKYKARRAVAFKNNEDAVSYVMEKIYGEDWELQLDDDEWEKQGEVAETYYMLTDEVNPNQTCTDDAGNTYQILEAYMA